MGALRPTEYFSFFVGQEVEALSRKVGYNYILEMD